MTKCAMTTAATVSTMTLALLCGCREGQGLFTGSPLFAPRLGVPAGTHLTVRLTTAVSSETAQVGDAWSGIVAHAVRAGGKVVLPAGSEVRGTVTGAQGARPESRALLDIAIEDVIVNGRMQPLPAATEPVIAGSPRARELGATAPNGEGNGKDAAEGGLMGGATAAGIADRSKGYPVALKPGMVMVFTVNEDLAMR